MVAGLIARVLDELLDLVKGDHVAPDEIGVKLARHFRLIGMRGIISAAVSGLDVACWDALAVAAKLPLATFLGGIPKAIPAYNSNGLGIMTPEEAANEAEELLAAGFRAIKLRLGYPTLKADLATTRAIRNRLADDVHLMVDFNQALTLAEALLRGRALDEEGLFWIEEPIRHDDYIGCATLASELATPIQIGENFAGPQAMAAAIDA
jgi:mandelate racemase